MRLHREKCLLFFFSFLMICSQIAAAQDKNTGQVSAAKSVIPAPEIEDPAPVSSSFFSRTGIDKTTGISRKKEKNEFSQIGGKPLIEDGKDDFRTIKVDERNFDFSGSAIKELKKLPFKMPASSADLKNEAKDETAPEQKEGFNWRGAFSQSFVFLGVQHGYALIFQKKTRRALKGKFWSDYKNSVKSLSGWDDGNKFFTNYIAHPMQGALTGFIYVQNSPQARRQQFGNSGAYWRSRMKALLWTTAWSTQFEIGPISQASIGNVGLKGKQTWVDMVITPTVGTALMITEEALDRYLIKSIERRTDNFYVKIFSRMLFNPTRIFANILRFKEPWYRDRPAAR